MEQEENIENKQEHSSNTKRIAKNTLMLYIRQILILFINLYAVRIVLNTLGAEDYGIYSVVGGIVTFFSFLSGTMASATQRFFSFALGENNQEKLKKIFSVNLIIYIGIAIIAAVLLETLGTWFVYNKLNIPDARFDAACFLFHFSVLTFLFTIIVSPFMAIIIAHEDMQIYALISTIEAVLKLVIVFVLQVLLGDKLKIYGILLFCVSIINSSLYLIVCVKKYSECQFKHFYWDKSIFKEIVGFTGWTMFGQVTSVCRTQAVTILINQVFNPIVVSARTIATQVSNYINIFASNFNTGLYPPIIKSYASKNKEEMFSLIFNGCKMTFFLMWVFALPLFLKMDYVLTLWLKEPPEYSVLFTRLALIEVLINSISLPITTAARAPGKMKKYELSLGSIQLLIFVADFVLFKFFNAPAYVVFIVAAVGNALMFVVRLIIVKGLINLPIVKFLFKVLMPVLEISIITSAFSYFISKILPDSFLFVVLFCVISCVFSCCIMYMLGLNKIERKKIVDIVLNKIRKNK